MIMTNEAKYWRSLFTIAEKMDGTKGKRIGKFRKSLSDRGTGFRAWACSDEGRQILEAGIKGELKNE